MNKSRLLGALCAVLFSLMTTSANAALLGRLPITVGGTDFQAAYDTVLDITWVTNAALSGPGTWHEQVAWADGLDYLGFKDWRLASMSVAAGLPTGTNPSVVICLSTNEAACQDNELGYMFFHNLGGLFFSNLTGNQTVGDVTLTDIQSNHWSGTASNDDFAWSLNFTTGSDNHNVNTKLDDGRYGWAVRTGDVPIPAAVWLFGSGLLGLIGIARRKKTA